MVDDSKQKWGRKRAQEDSSRVGSWSWVGPSSPQKMAHQLASAVCFWPHKAPEGPTIARSMKGKMEPEQRQALIEEGKKIKEDWDVDSEPIGFKRDAQFYNF